MEITSYSGWNNTSCPLVTFFITTVLSNQDSLIGIEEATVTNRDCCADMSHRNIELGLSTEHRE